MAIAGVILAFLVYAVRNTPTAIVVVLAFVAVLLTMAGWCVYCARRVRRWEKEYEQVMVAPMHDGM